MSDSPSEYVEELRAQNRILRANIVQLVHEKQQLEDAIARMSAYVLATGNKYIAEHRDEYLRPPLEAL